VPALKLDRRIGPRAYLDPGLGIAGGNLERDLRTVRTLAEAKGTDAGIIDAWLANSRRRKEWCWDRLEQNVLRQHPDARIALLGLAYKADTDSTKNSPSLALLAHLKGMDVRVHDPVVPSSVAAAVKRFADSITCVAGADVLVIMTPWAEYRELSIDALRRTMRGRVLIDPYRVLDGRAAAAAGFAYHALGMPALPPK
jgi:UDPglucose 6-dehydrogenase